MGFKQGGDERGPMRHTKDNKKDIEYFLKVTMQSYQKKKNILQKSVQKVYLTQVEITLNSFLEDIKVWIKRNLQN